MMTRAESILESMENAHDYQTLREMNGKACASRQIAAFKRLRMSTLTEADRIKFEQQQARARRASRFAHRGFEKSRAA